MVTAAAATGTSVARGNAYWIRHGESESNENTIYAGVLDTRLTNVGVLQGRNAGLDMRRQLVDCGIKIDAVYVSYLSRALETYREALRACGGPTALLRNGGDAIEPELRVDIAERNFGLLTCGNYAMLMRVLGYHQYHDVLHSRDESPQGGEGMQSIFLRSRKFYTEVVEPRLARGENVLVVSHSYVLMAMAYAVAGRDLSQFKFFNVPNGQVLDNRALVAEMGRETTGFKHRLTVVSDYASMHTLKCSVAAFFSATLLKLVLPPFVFDGTLLQVLVVALLALSTFYVYLDVNMAVVFRKTSYPVWLAVGCAAVLRWGLALALIGADSTSFGVDAQDASSNDPSKVIDVELFRCVFVSFWRTYHGTGTRVRVRARTYGGRWQL